LFFIFPAIAVQNNRDETMAESSTCFSPSPQTLPLEGNDIACSAHDAGMGVADIFAIMIPKKINEIFQLRNNLASLFISVEYSKN